MPSTVDDHVVPLYLLKGLLYVCNISLFRHSPYFVVSLYQRKNDESFVLLMFNVKPRWLTWHIPNAECNTIYLSVHCRLGYNCSDCSVTYFRPPGVVLGLWNSIRCFLSLLLPFLRCPLIDSHWNMITNYILLVVSCIYNFKTLFYLLKPVLTKRHCWKWTTLD